MHIVMLSDNLPPEAPGGAGKIAWELGRGLIAAGHRVTFVTTVRDETRVENRHGITVHALHAQYPARFSAWLGLYNPWTVIPLNNLLRELSPDVVHAHSISWYLSYHSLVIAQYAGAATVFTAHDVMPFAYGKLSHFASPDRPDQLDGWDYRLPPGYNLRRMRLRWNPFRNLSIRHTMFHFVDRRVSVSHALKQALEANRLPPFQAVHNGVDPAAFAVPAASVAALRQRLGLEGRRVILFGGRLNRMKGDLQLLAALRKVKAQVPDVTLLVLARSSDYAQSLVADHLDLTTTLVFGGWLQDAELAAAYRLSHVVASPSICFDSFPTMNLEGMAAGVVPVTTCFGGGGEAVLDGETGFVVNPYDVDTLADRLITVLTDDALRAKMAEAGHQRFMQSFTLERQVNAMLDVYATALDKKRREEANG
ncbi:MAG: glycosyltransferase family 4 protein [Chloroflexi bacterium]|nr:glycosyltransferase family 4 protein [Chloroflexota bacterium]